MTADLTGLLAGRQAHPSAIPLGHGPDPAALVPLLNPVDQPAVLWGRWFGGGVVVMRSPLRTRTAATVADVLGLIDDHPTIADDGAERSDPVPVIGGGWLSCLGFTPGLSAALFYDSLLRWQPTRGWTFETLGVAGREDVVHNELQAWRSLLRSAIATTPPLVSAARFTTLVSPVSTRLHYLASIDAAIGRIHAGAFYQINLCTRLVSSSTDSAAALFAQLAAQLDPAYGGLLITADQQSGVPGRAVVSVSPELFLRVRGSTVVTSPIKGTATRDPGDANSRLLRASAKDAAENIMIVDLMRNDLSQVCRPGTVTVDDLLEVQPHPGLWHLVSTVSGQLANGVTTGQLLAATFPPGSVTGAPKYSALGGIADLEPCARGSYTGTLGFSSPLAGADFNVLIRTLECSNDRIELGVGGGITVDSVAIREWDECLAKAAPLVAALGSDVDPDLQPSPHQISGWQRSGGLLETMLTKGSSVRRLAAHLARLDRSCRELYGEGIPVDLAGQITTAVAGRDVGSATRRVVRVVAQPDTAGLAFDVSVAALGPRPSDSSLALAARSELCWRHKWADRRELERAEHEQGGRLPYFLTAGGGQVAETTRGNLFCQRSDGVWLTPPLDDDLLPGVTRREVLDIFVRASIPFSIEFFSAQMLRRSAAAFWTSSLSGAVPVNAVDGCQLSEPQALIALLNAELGIS